MGCDNLSDRAAHFVLTCDDESLGTLTVSALARRLDVDRSHLARRFKSNKNFTLCKFIQQEKMARAALQLANDFNLTIQKLSEKFGFCSAEYFREVFKSYFMVAPSKYRECKNYYNNK